jgi:rhomboid protease GluP
MDFTTAEPLAPESQAPPPQAPPPASAHTRGRNVITLALIAINVLVFFAMLASGVSFTQPTALDVFNWGANYGPATVGEHQWWRLLTACFLHFGIIHIGFNMYVLYQIGPFIEIVFGRARYLVIYFIAGLFGSLVSVWIHPQAVSAGASGAIFGLYGAVFGFLLIKRRTLNPAATKSIAKSAGIFVLYNVIYGSMSGTTDLSAHFGGLVAGFLAGAALARPQPNAG